MGCCQSACQTQKDYNEADIQLFIERGQHKTLDDVKPDIDKAILCLKNCDSYATEEATSALEVLIHLASIGSNLRKEAASYLAQVGYGQLYVEMTKSLYEFRRGLERDGTGVYNLMLIQMAFWNFTDVCADLGRDLGKHGGVEMLLNDLDVLEEYRSEKQILEYLEVLLGILHNAIHLYSSNRPIYRKENAIHILTKLLKSEDMTVKMKALLVLAYCVDEEESEILATAHGCVSFLTNMLKKAVGTIDHRVISGNSRFSAKELLSGLNHLAVNDENKCEVQREDGISIIARMLQSDFSQEEQRLAAEALWNLSFVETIRKNTLVVQCTSVLEALSTSTNKGLQEASTFALWEIKDGDMDLLDTPTQCSEAPIKKDLDDNQHVMISYQWDSQQLALNMKESLITAGYRVWMDVDKMQGNILSSMADAIERSAVVVVCMSQKYKASLNCRSEASYAYKKKKPIIPLLVEDGYEPDGWLGLLLGMQLYYKAFSEEILSENIPAIVGEIKGRWYGNMGSEIEAVDSPIVIAQQESEVTEKLSPSLQEDTKSTQEKHKSNTDVAIQDNVRGWSKDQVQKWFEENDLAKLCSLLSFCDGKHLLTMHNRHSLSPESFQMDLKSDLDLDFNTRLKFSTAMDELLKQD